MKLLLEYCGRRLRSYLLMQISSSCLRIMFNYIQGTRCSGCPAYKLQMLNVGEILKRMKLSKGKDYIILFILILIVFSSVFYKDTFLRRKITMEEEKDMGLALYSINSALGVLVIEGTVRALSLNSISISQRS